MRPRKVLLAEDDLDDQKLFHDFLFHRSDIVLMSVVENGEELLDELNTISDMGNLPDLIILDQNMPKKNGIQTLQFLKNEARYADINVVIYSTYADQQLINVALKNGASKVVSKPITMEGYSQMMDDLLQLVS